MQTTKQSVNHTPMDRLSRNCQVPVNLVWSVVSHCACQFVFHGGGSIYRGSIVFVNVRRRLRTVGFVGVSFAMRVDGRPS